MAPEPETKVFPTVRWSVSCRNVTFSPSPAPAVGGSVRAVVVFAWQDGQFVLANIRGRGWCVPSGRIEPGETHGQAAVRETYEETGVELMAAREIGTYVLTDDAGEEAYVPVFVGRVRARGPIPAGSESLGARLAYPEQIPSCYYRWDELIARVFAYAEQRLEQGPPRDP